MQKITDFFSEKNIVKDSRPCNTEEDIKATMEINRKMEIVEQEFRSRQAASLMKIKNFIFD
jgi:hypothetical protein